MKISSTSVILGITAIGALVFAAYYMKGRKKKQEETTIETPAPAAPAAPAPTTQESLARATGMGLAGQRLVQTPVGYMMN